jgi:hypothetical protein
MDHNHELTDIHHYTLRQIRVFSAAAIRRDKRMQAWMIQAVMLGAQGTSEVIEEALEELRD